MFPLLMVTVALAAPPSVAAIDQTENSPREPSATKPTPTLDQIRETYLDVLQKSARRAQPKLPEVVPALAEVYGHLTQVEGLSHAERSRMRSIVKARLEEFRDKLIRELLRNKKLADRRKRGSQRARTSERGEDKAELLAGGGPNIEAVKLIDLIQNAIAPESWQRTGGKGSVSYFSLFQVLVVRQTGEVHHQLGGALGQLRP